jgi:hypothetical protein
MLEALVVLPVLVEARDPVVLVLAEGRDPVRACVGARLSVVLPLDTPDVLDLPGPAPVLDPPASRLGSCGGCALNNLTHTPVPPL